MCNHLFDPGIFLTIFAQTGWSLLYDYPIRIWYPGGYQGYLEMAVSPLLTSAPRNRGESRRILVLNIRHLQSVSDTHSHHGHCSPLSTHADGAFAQAQHRRRQEESDTLLERAP
ncbi:MAG TPA: hypothetical protein VFV38_16855 [Ktedonobacteraceae bacterium]|nr:hypothetical protein [Ktedonobacteraceae bacterium]